MKKKKLTSLTVALGIGVMLSPAAASAQEQAGTQPGTEAPVESHEAESADSNADAAKAQPGTEERPTDSESAAQPVDSTVQPGTETRVPKAEETPEKLPDAPVDADTGQPGTEEQAPEQAEQPSPADDHAPAQQPGTEEVEAQPAPQEQVEQAPQEPVETAQPEPVEQPAPAQPAPQEQVEQAPVNRESDIDEQAVEDALTGVVDKGQAAPAPADVPASEAPAAATPVAQDNPAPVVAEEVTEELQAPAPEGIAGAELVAAGHGEEFTAATNANTSAVQAEFAGNSVESSTNAGVVINGEAVASAQEVQTANVNSEAFVNALPESVKSATDAAYDRVQDGLAALPEQQAFSAAGVNAELSVQHWA
ncbi:hypothetical protein ACTXJN_11690 [Corynebacterium casei]|uniref:hypothetical protein n=1 Tax=Corynebacterium casei TaxID=160386 RepID=UPI003FD4E3BE